MKRAARNPESGYALLFVYMMAAVVAIMLFTQLPRVAFEAQRDKEQLLIDRGEQYSRAINLYVRKFNKYPADFDALNNTQNQRFLRHKFIDPMTGKDDWRIVHVGPGGVFTDSLVYNKKKDDKTKDKSDQQNFITELQQTGGNQVDPNQQNVNLATRQRPSDQPGAPGDPNNPAQQIQQLDANGQPVGSNPVPGQAGYQQPVMPNQFAPGMNGIPNPAQTPQAGLQQTPAQQPNGFPYPQQQQQQQQQQQPFQPAGQQPEPFGQQSNQSAQQPTPFGQQQAAPFGQQPTPFGQAANQFPQQPNFGQQQTPFGQAANQPGQQSNVPTGGPPSAAANMIGQLLTTPRPGGLNGIGGVQQESAMGQNGNPVQTGGMPGAGSTPGTPVSNMAATTGQTIGGGIAGVASKLEREGIKVYKDEKSYNKWEFVYDITKDPMRGGGQTIPQNGAAQNGAQQNGLTGTQPGASSAGGGNSALTGSTPGTTTPTSSPSPTTSSPFSSTPGFPQTQQPAFSPTQQTPGVPQYPVTPGAQPVPPPQ